MTDRFLPVPWMTVVVTKDTPSDQPVKVWFDTESGPGYERVVPAEERWRIWDCGNRTVFLLDASPEDAEALRILGNVRALWGSYQLDPDDQEPL